VHAELGELAALLRAAGFDVLCCDAAEDLVRISRDEKRILLARDCATLSREGVTHAYCVQETDPRRQLDEVVRRFDLWGRL
jgi:uncharacterized protein with PIN domain